jgi:hypothetical protein
VASDPDTADEEYEEEGGGILALTRASPLVGFPGFSISESGERPEPFLSRDMVEELFVQPRRSRRDPRQLSQHYSLQM